MICNLLNSTHQTKTKMEMKKRKSKSKKKKETYKDRQIGNKDNVSGPAQAAPAPVAFDGSNLQLPLPTWWSAAE